jgi:hypothetical protein
VEIGAFLNPLYFEVQLSGHTDNTSAAQVAAQFLNVMQTQTK